VDGFKPSPQEKRILKLLKNHPDCPKKVSVRIEYRGIQDAEVHVDGNVPEYVVKTAVFLGLPFSFKKTLFLNGNKVDGKLSI
jgi:hypothetical protein